MTKTTSHAETASGIPGRIELETDEPVVLRADEGSSRRWLIPAVLMSLVVLYVLFRRRRDSD